MGDMDFKIAGTKKGITAVQADIKIPGLPLKVIMEAVQKATEAKSKIIDIMNQTIDKPRLISFFFKSPLNLNYFIKLTLLSVKAFINLVQRSVIKGALNFSFFRLEKKQSWPLSKRLEIEQHKRSKFYGVGGIHLKKLFVETGVQVSQIDDNTFEMFAPDQQAMDEADEMINRWLTSERAVDLEFGGIYKASIVEIRDIGVMVTLYPGMPPALLHNSQLDQRKVSSFCFF